MEYKDEEDHILRDFFLDAPDCLANDNETEMLSEEELTQVIEDAGNFFQDGDEKMLNKALKVLISLFKQAEVPDGSEDVVTREDLFSLLMNILSSEAPEDTIETALSLSICLERHFIGFGEEVLARREYGRVVELMEGGRGEGVRTRAAVLFMELVRRHKRAVEAVDSRLFAGFVRRTLGVLCLGHGIGIGSGSSSGRGPGFGFGFGFGRGTGGSRALWLLLAGECLRVALVNHGALLRVLEGALAELGETQRTAQSEAARAVCVRGLLEFGRRGGDQLRLLVRTGCVEAVAEAAAGLGGRALGDALRLLELAFREVDGGFLVSGVRDVPMAAFMSSLYGADPNFGVAVRAMTAVAAVFGTVREQCVREEIVERCVTGLQEADFEGKVAVVGFLAQHIGAMDSRWRVITELELFEGLAGVYGAAGEETRREIEAVSRALLERLPVDLVEPIEDDGPNRPQELISPGKREEIIEILEEAGILTTEEEE